MNQILVSEKLYVTPDMRKKKVFFRLQFFLSVFLLCILSSCYIYAEYDRQKSEKVSQEIIANIEFEEPEPELVEETVVVVLNAAFNASQDVDEIVSVEMPEIPEVQTSKAKDGTEYYTIGIINIPKLNINYPILSETTESLLKISPCKFWGPGPNQVGNLCIAGHNYRNSKFFSKIPTLEKGDIIEITDLANLTVKYEVYDKYIVEPNDTSCTNQKVNGERQVTLITCTNDNKQRGIIKTREIV